MPSVPDKLTHVYRSDSTTMTYHSPWVNERTARKAVERVGKYNYFKPKYVRSVIEAIDAADPNALFSIGREGSPVIYVQTHKPKSVMGVFSSMGDELKQPDELDLVTGGPRADSYLERLPKKERGASVVRAWWD